MKNSNKICEKILSFIVNDKNEFLLLKGNENDPQLNKSIWYVVTGSKEDFDKSFEDTVIREIKEETNLDVLDMIDMHWTLEYKSLGCNCTEKVYLSKVNNNTIILNEESVDYEWLTFDDFIKKIDWFYDKEELEKRLKNIRKFNI